jgi:capsid protein
MLAAKDASSRANIVYTDSGEVPQSISPIGRPLTATTAGTDDRQTYYEKAFGGKTVALRKGDRWDQAESQRPSAAMREFWEYLTDLCCKGVGISYAAVSDYSGKWGGAALRGAVTSDNRFYEIRTRSLSSAFQRIYEYAIGWAINSGELMDPPTDWYRVRWQPPRRASVDIGRESAAILNELRAGIRTYRDVLGELGLDWQEVLRQRAEEEKYVAQLAAEYGVRPSQIVAIDPNERAQMNAQPSQPEAPTTDE